MLKKPSNLLFKPFNKNNRLKKEKFITTVTSKDLRDLSYIIDQSAKARFQGFCVVNKNYINDIQKVLRKTKCKKVQIL